MIYVFVVVFVRCNYVKVGVIRFYFDSFLDDFVLLCLFFLCVDLGYVLWYLFFLNGYSMKCLLIELSLVGWK